MKPLTAQTILIFIIRNEVFQATWELTYLNLMENPFLQRKMGFMCMIFKQTALFILMKSTNYLNT